MSGLELIDERKIGVQFGVVIANCDLTGLNDEEDLMFDDWLSQFGKNDYPIVMSGCVDMHNCDITGFYGDCINVGIYRNR